MFFFLGSTLNRYFCRNFFFWLVVSLAVILSVVSLFEAIELLRRSVSRPGIPLWLISEMVLLKIPFHVNSLLPFISFFAVLLSLWRLNQNQEILSARAAGLSIWQLVGGLSGAVGLLYAVYLFLMNPVGSALLGRYAQLDQIYFSHSANLLSVSAHGLWLCETSPNKRTIIHAKSFDLKDNRFSDVTFYDFDNRGSFTDRVDAQQGQLLDEKWYLEHVHHWHKKDQSQSSEPSFSRETDLSLDKIEDNYAAPETLSFWQIPDFIKILRKTGLSSVRYQLYWHKQIAKIGLMVSMTFLATLFCLQPTRYRHTSYLLGGGVLLGFIIYFLSDIIYALGLAEKVPMLLSVWAVPLVTMMVSTTCLLHLENPS